MKLLKLHQTGNIDRDMSKLVMGQRKCIYVLFLWEFMVNDWNMNTRHHFFCTRYSALITTTSSSKIGTHNSQSSYYGVRFSNSIPFRQFIFRMHFSKDSCVSIFMKIDQEYYDLRIMMVCMISERMFNMSFSDCFIHPYALIRNGMQN